VSVAGEELYELLATRATEGLESTESARLNELLAQSPTADPEGFELAAAAVHLALIDREQPMPVGLRSRIFAGWQETQASDRLSPETDGDFASSGATRDRYGWWVAAAAVVIALVGWWPRLMDPAPSLSAPPVETVAPAEAPSTADLRVQLLAAPETLTLPWTITEDQAAVAASGDVVWNGNQQSGFMRIAGLEINDPAVAQYQLWIFDRLRDERYPVDGGVFDVSVDGEAIVPIDARVEVGEPYLFAVTVEGPGGVVVSSRERIVLLAQG